MKARSPAFDALALHCTASRRYDALRAGLLQWARYQAAPAADGAVRRLLYDAAALSLGDALRQEAGRGLIYDLLVVARDELGPRPEWTPPAMACGHGLDAFDGGGCAECVSARASG